MGVHGLTSFMERERRFLASVRVQATALVVDGSSLYFSLYFSSGADQQHGGEYQAFAAEVRRFFATLAACRIQAFVVLDGGMDQSDKKFSTLQERAQRSIRDANSLSRGANGSVLPLLTKVTFMQLLSELAVPFFQCAAEADLELATLASQWGCPVLTNDSDFYIFPLSGGYLPYRHFQWNNAVLGGGGGGRTSQQGYIQARCYTVQRLCSHFRGLTPPMLPLLAVVVGNDYTPRHVTQTFLSRIQLPAVGGGGGKGNPQIEGLLLWLSQFGSPEDALEEALGVEEGGGGGGGGRGGKRGGRGQRKKGGQSSVYTALMEEYAIPPHSSLAQFFSSDPASSLPACTAGLPEVLAAQPTWLLWGIFTGRFPSIIQDALVHNRVMLLAQVENCRLPSSHSTSLAIRQVIYGLLLLGRGQQHGGTAQSSSARGRGGGSRGGRGRGGRGGGGGGPVSGEVSPAESQGQEAAGVVEYDRCDMNLTKNTVTPFLPGSSPPLRLEAMEQAPVAVRLKVLLRVLCVEERSLGPLPPALRLPACVTSYWVQRSKPRPDPSTHQALLLGLVCGELSRRRTIPTDPASSRPGVAAVINRLNQLRLVRKEGRGLNLGVAHSLSQWQSCMKAGLCLNQLLCCPLPDPPCTWLYSGTLIHAIQAALQEGKSAEDLLAQDPFPGQLFSALKEATQPKPGGSSNPAAHQGVSSSGRGRRGRGGRGQGRGQLTRGGGGRGGGRGQRSGGGDSGINNRFAMLMSDEDNDDDEEEVVYVF
ncbi:protein asteroid homolog 1 [Engraulis encrasicolus]|uniref:protein asteroid homolog 1 n=1 Tax=Engraulis encrasicolus TaxID=184585 RepID=UPI002FD4F98B